MAYCPKCNGEMSTTAVACPHCGFDFPDEGAAVVKQGNGFAYSPLADVALVVSSFAAAVGACFTLYIMFVFLLAGQLVNGLVFCPLAFLLQIGMLVVFLRVQE